MFIVYQYVYCLSICLFCSISDMQWNGPNIIVLDTVTISPPYRQEQCSSTDEKGLAQVKRLVSVLHFVTGVFNFISSVFYFILFCCWMLLC